MSFEDMPKRLERKTIYESEYVCLYADKVEMPDGYIIENYHQVHYPKDAVSIVVFNEKDEILMIRSKRYTTMRIEWEVPAGKIEPGEEPEAAARRECMEETGCTLKDLQYLCCFYPTVGALDTKVYAFCATVDTEATSFDTNEVQGKQWMSVKDALNLLQTNEMQNGISMLSILYALQFREKR